MTTSSTIVVPALAAIVVGAVLFGCTGPQPVIREGNADTVEILYGGDPASALPLARRHCAQYERVPRLRTSGGDIAVFDCVPQ